MKKSQKKTQALSRFFSSSTLLFSASTLLCCAIPALMVYLGMGAALVSLLSAAPFLVTLSKHKIWLFVATGVLIATSGYLLLKARRAPCPADPRAAKKCQRTRRISWVMFISAVLIYVTGIFYAYIAPHLFY